MKIIQSWDTRSFIGEFPYRKALYHPPDELQSIAPPSLRDLNRVIRIRSDYAERWVRRNEMARALLESHRRRGAPESTLRSIERLGNPSSFLIVAGQQPGLLTGPMLTVYKIMHAINLARRLSLEREETFIPAFWNAAEDHDFEEIAAVRWLNKDKSISCFLWQNSTGADRPYTAIPMAECPIDDLLTAIRESVYPTEFTDTMFEHIRSCANAAIYPDFIDRLIWSLFPNEGLLILRPDDGYTRIASAPIIQLEIEQPVLAAQSVARLGDRLERNGLSPQIHKNPDRVSFFMIANNKRVALRYREGRFVGDRETSYRTDELIRQLAASPESFSPSAVLRPVVQDAVFPTAAVILGPSELAYHFLLHELYETHRVPRPCLVPRWGATLVEPRDLKWLARYGLEPARLKENSAALAKSIVFAEHRDDWETLKHSVIESIAGLFDIWKNRMEQIDPTMVNTLAKNQVKIIQELNQSESLLVRKIGDKNRQVQDHVNALRNSIYPDGTLQERVLNIFMFLSKYGPEFISNLLKASRGFEEGEHYFVEIP